MFSPKEVEYYERQLILPGFGTEGQKLLKQAKVLIVGAGGLGCPVMQYLASAGVGRISVIDPDIINTSNLHRQILYNVNDIGFKKAEIAAQKLGLINPFVKIKSIVEKLTEENADSLISGNDVIIDCTDNFSARYLINDYCIKHKKPFVYGAIYQFEGFVSVFNVADEDGKFGPNYRDLYPTPPITGKIKNCEETGIMGVLAGIIGTVQANETIKLLAHIGSTLSGKLFVLDSKTMKSLLLPITKKEKNQHANAAHYDLDECTPKSTNTRHNLTPKELSHWLKEKKDFVLVDIRPFTIAGMLKDSLHIPIQKIENSMGEIPKDKDVVLYCQKGINSLFAISLLKSKYGYSRVFHLEGGKDNWDKHIKELV